MSQALSLAGFQVTLIGRFWVTAEVNARFVYGSAPAYPAMGPPLSFRQR